MSSLALPDPRRQPVIAYSINARRRGSGNARLSVNAHEVGIDYIDIGFSLLYHLGIYIYQDDTIEKSQASGNDYMDQL